MRLWKFATALLLLATASVRADEFGDVSVEQVPGLNLGLSCLFAEFRVENHGTAPSEVVLAYERLRAPQAVSRTLLVPPGGTVLASLYLPNAGMWGNGGKISVTVDGKYWRGNFRMNFWKNSESLFAPNWRSSHVGATSKLEGESTLDPVQWPSQPQCYAGLKTICLFGEDLPQRETMETIENFARLGGKLFIEFPAEASGRDGARLQVVDYPLFGGSRTEAHGNTDIPEEFLKDSPSYGRDDYGDDDDIYGFQAIRRRLPVPKVPVYWLALLMLGFVAVIGPVNYFVLRKFHREMWILVTTPLLSLAFCAAVVVAITFNEGWRSWGAARGMTWLDQRDGLAVTKANVGLYSPLGFYRGLSFDYNELVKFPGRGDKPMDLDLTAGQHYLRSTVQPRVPLYYEVSSVSHRSERLTFRAVEGRDELEVVNGLGADIDRLAVMFEGGTYVSEAPVAAGARAALVRREPKNKLAMFNRNRLWSASDYIEFGTTAPEAILQSFDDFTYVAYCAKPLFYNPGTTPDQFDADHIVVGRFDGVEK
ncbi:MAG: hypothetical protein AB7F40_07165 [Victivallaceae bacterium]|nr:hypothetical protein [Victivallaceae bacterium]